MMKKYQLLAGLLLSLTLSAASVADNNLLPDGDFERPLEKTKWKIISFKGCNGSIERTAILPAKGEYALQMTSRESRTGWMELFSPPMYVENCRKMECSFLYRSTAKNLSSIQIIVRRMENGKYVNLNLPGTHYAFEKSDKWTPVCMTIAIPTENQKDRLLLMLKITHWGSAKENSSWLDEIQLATESE